MQAFSEQERVNTSESGVDVCPNSSNAPLQAQADCFRSFHNDVGKGIKLLTMTVKRKCVQNAGCLVKILNYASERSAIKRLMNLANNLPLSELLAPLQQLACPLMLWWSAETLGSVSPGTSYDT